MRKRHQLVVIFMMVLALVAGLAPTTVAAEETAAKEKPTAKDSSQLLKPELFTEQAPDSYRVKVETTQGDLTIEVTRAWAPNGADRFYNLVKAGFYQDVAFFRVIEGFMAQAGYHGDPAVNAAWKAATIPDDPIVKNNETGMVTFAMSSAPNSRSTQIFINYTDNSYLRQHGKFASFGRVIKGMDTVRQLYAGYGEGAPSGRGPSQARIAREGNSYLHEEFPKLDYIKKMTLVD